MHLNGKNRKILFNGRKVARNEQMDRKFMFMKIFWAQGVVCPCPGAIHLYDHNIQTSSSLKPLGQSKPNLMWSILRKRKVCINGQGHMTKIAAMAINSKNL